MAEQISLYRLCSKACDDLIQNGEIFTEIDIVAAVLGEAEDEDFQEVLRYAAQVAGTKWRERKLCRYGPVHLSGDECDYARIATKIAVAGSGSGPESFSTPNGDFPKLMIEVDPMKQQGRRHGTNRDDTKPWADQNIRVAVPVAAPIPASPDATIRALQRQIEDLQARMEVIEKVEAGRRQLYEVS